MLNSKFNPKARLNYSESNPNRGKFREIFLKNKNPRNFPKSNSHPSEVGFAYDKCGATAAKKIMRVGY
jgi:hypothetical protein